MSNLAGRAARNQRTRRHRLEHQRPRSHLASSGERDGESRLAHREPPCRICPASPNALTCHIRSVAAGAPSQPARWQCMTGSAAHLCALANADVAQDGGRGTNQDIVADLGMPVAMNLARACARTRGPEVQRLSRDLRITTARLSGACRQTWIAFARPILHSRAVQAAHRQG